MQLEDLIGRLSFIAAAERLKDVERSGWTSAGRRDTVAGHSWRLSLMALTFHREFPEVDLGRLLSLCILHDLGEAIHGDIPAPAQRGLPDKSAAERADFVQLVAPLPPADRAELIERWDEYQSASTIEGRVAKGLDKLETILQHNQGANPIGFDYDFNLGYGRQYTDLHPVVAAVRAELDARTERRSAEGRTAARDTAGVRIDPQLVYLIPLIVGLVLGRFAPLRFIPPSLGARVGIGLLVLGLVVCVSAVTSLRRAKTTIQPWEPTTSLVLTGLYRFSRNPIYLGYTLLYLGAAVWLDASWSVVLLPVALIAMHRLVIGREEAYLERRLGDAYRSYRERVRRWL
jgi:putative hydrolase of HD superfamily